MLSVSAGLSGSQRIVHRIASPAPTVHGRLCWLDYLRGVLAFAVMLYHLTDWNGIHWPLGFNSLINKLGPFAVSGFYIISGYSIAYVYFRKNLNVSFLGSFTIKRFFRLAPLLWVAIFLFFLMGYEITTQKLLLNVSMLFGFVAHDQYIATGSWSIGNEMVFYALFPLLMLCPKFLSPKLWCLVVLAVSTIFAIWSALYWIPGAASDAVHWSRYIHPANQLWLFVSGVALCLFRGDRIPPFYVLTIGLAALLAFVLFPASGSSLYEGWSRLLLCMLLITVVWACGLLHSQLPKLADRPLHLLGAWSYSIYLLHPVANHFVRWLNADYIHTSQAVAAVFLTIPLSLFMSALAFRYVEAPGICIGKHLSTCFCDLMGERPMISKR